MRTQFPLLTLSLLVSLTGCGPTIFIEPDTGPTTEGDDTSVSDANAESDADPDAVTSSTSGAPDASTTDGDDTGPYDPPTDGGTTTSDDPGVSVELGDPSPCLLGGNMLVFDGDRGDYIHPGSDVVVTASWEPNTVEPDEIRMTINPTDETQGLWWWLWFSSTEIPAPLEPGLYEDAMRVPFEDPGHPGLDISGDGRGCNQVVGTFEIHELVIDGGSLITLTATWSQYCEGGVDELRGCVHYSG